jgi:hypothetical protein
VRENCARGAHGVCAIPYLEPFHEGQVLGDAETTMRSDDTKRTKPVEIVALSDDGAPVAARSEEPPIVARLMIEIRSDGTRTIARGAMEDVALGQKAAIEAEGTTPLALALELAKSLGTIPAIATATLREQMREQLRDQVKAKLRGLLPKRMR